MESRLKIVILDDNEIFAALMAAALEEEFDIALGHNGLQGISLCLEGGVAAVVTDIGMPDLDGVGMLKQLAKDPRLAAIPVLVITATHFTRLSRDEVSRYPQVKRMLSKTTSVDVLAGEVRAVLRENGALPPAP
jgi:CheY-like chemotaxis protein